MRHKSRAGKISLMCMLSTKIGNTIIIIKNSFGTNLRKSIHALENVGCCGE